MKSQTVSVYCAASLWAVHGVSEGDSLSFADDLVLDDIYELTPQARTCDLRVSFGPRLRHLRIVEGSQLGSVGNVLHLDSCLTLMDQDGHTCELLVMVEVENDMAARIYALPLSTITPEGRYRLVGIDRHAATRRFAEVACISFAQGTRITMADGQQKPVEEVREGDMVLTRDAGPQPLRWNGQTTVRASGAFAPVRIAAGALNNARDLVVSPDHRIFVYQRRDAIGAGRAEVMVKARHLINDTTVTQEEGGFVVYHQLLFDSHEVIYAEGIASESLVIDPRTREALPDHVAARLSAQEPRQSGPTLADYEVRESLVSATETVRLLKEAAAG